MLEANIMMHSGSPFFILVCIYNIEILNLFDPERQMINTKPVTKSKLKVWFDELKSLKCRKF